MIDCVFKIIICGSKWIKTYLLENDYSTFFTFLQSKQLSTTSQAESPSQADRQIDILAFNFGLS